MNKKLLLCILSLFMVNVFAVDEEKIDTTENVEMRSFRDCDDDEKCCNSLSLKDLCVRQVKAKKALVKDLCAASIKSANICADNLGIVGQVALNNVCANNINASTLCITGTARINEVCGLYRASAQLLADTPYVFGSPVNYDQIIDDPNNNVSLAPFYYTVPVSGYYIASVEIDEKDLMGTTPVLGVPVSQLALKVNGINRRKALLPFLTFNDTQQTDLSFLLLLNAGDKITVDYNVLVVDQATGTQPYAGTATLIGGPNATIFKIHYLSSTCSSSTCQPCSFADQPCDLSCTPLPNSCVSK